MMTIGLSLAIIGLIGMPFACSRDMRRQRIAVYLMAPYVGWAVLWFLFGVR